MSGPRTEPVFSVRVIPKKPKSTAKGQSAAEKQARLDLERSKQLGQLYGASAAQGNAEARTMMSKADADAVRAQAVLAAEKAKRQNEPVPKPALAENPGESLAGSITSFTYEDSEKKTDILKLSVRNEDLRFFDHPIFEKGTMLEVRWGYPDDLAPARQVFVKKVKGSLTLSIEADDRGALMNKQAKTRTFAKMKRSDVARAIAEEQGFGGSSLFIEDTAVVFPVITQAASTDAQFLKKLADLEGFEFFVDFDGFHWRKRVVSKKPVRKLTYYLPPNVGDIITFDVENDVTAKPGATTVKGRNPLEKKDISVTADATNTPRDTLAPTQEIVAKAEPVTFVERVDPRTGETYVSHPAPAKNAGASDPNTSGAIQPTSATSDAQAKREATGQFVRTQQGSVLLTATLVGDPRLAAKTVVQIEGLGKRLSGRYYLTEVVHKIDGSGYTTTIKARTDGTNKGGGTKKDKGKPNEQNADAKKGDGDVPPPLTAVDIVDGRTGETKTVYKDTRGKT